MNKHLKKYKEKQMTIFFKKMVMGVRGGVRMKKKGWFEIVWAQRSVE